MNFTIDMIRTKPESDPYTNPTFPSRTNLYIDPEQRTVYVDQDYRTNSTPSGIWHGRLFVVSIPDWPLEPSMREWIEGYADNINNIIEGYSCEWNGSNHVGRLTHDARRELEYLKDGAESLYSASHYEFWNLDDYCNPFLHEITAETTDEELTQYTDVDDYIVLDGDIMDYLRRCRDELRNE